MAGGLRPPDSVIATWNPNLNNPETRGASIIVLASVLLAVCYLVVSLRVWVRFHKAKNFGLDDTLIVLSLVSLIHSGVGDRFWLTRSYSCQRQDSLSQLFSVCCSSGRWSCLWLRRHQVTQGMVSISIYGTIRFLR
jgi:hypothetical protein